MKKGVEYTGIVEKVKFPAKAYIAVDGEEKKAIAKNAVCGQKVRFRVTKKRKDKVEGNILEVLEKAPNEIDSVCPHFGECGGCNYQNLSYEDQLSLKASQVKDLLDEVYIKTVREVNYEFEGIKESPRKFGYRNKMEFSFGDEYKDGPLSLGLHKRGSFYDIVPVLNCKIVDEDYRLILKTVLEYFQKHNIPFYHRMRQTGYLRHLLVRKAVKTGEILVALVTTSMTECASDVGGYKLDEAELLKGFKETLLSLENKDVDDSQSKESLVDGLQEKEKEQLPGKLQGKFAGIVHTVNDSVADVVKEDQSTILYGQDYFYEELMGLKFKISQFSFFQTNSLGAEVLYDKAREYIGLAGNDKIVFDLYSGTGTIAQMMAAVAKKVVGVEIVKEAVFAAKENAEMNGLHNCEFLAGDVLKVIDDITEKPDLIILDPPRDGIHPKALTKIINYGVDRIVYISCKPTSLARDLEVFLESGYVMEKACAVDMFPATSGIETVALLVKE